MASHLMQNPSDALPSQAEAILGAREKPPREAAECSCCSLRLRFHPELLVAGQRAAGSGHGDKTGRGSGRNRGLQVGIGPNVKGCGGSIERDSGCAGESLPENLDGFAHPARSGH